MMTKNDTNLIARCGSLYSGYTKKEPGGACSRIDKKNIPIWEPEVFFFVYPAGGLPLAWLGGGVAAG